MVEARSKTVRMEPRPPGTVPGAGPGLGGDAPRPGEARRSPAKRPSRYAPGELIADKYRLTRLLGRGGMGEVWLARHEHLKSDLAIKFLDRPPAARASDDVEAQDASYVLERFRFEAQISAQLGARTRHIVSVHDAGTHGAAPYLAMEYVPGRTLEAVVDELGMIGPEPLADILDQVGEALTVAHELGIVHRDIKPSNIMLVDDASGTATGAICPGAITAKLADFGVAKAVRSDLTIDRPKETLEGLLVGSPAYMSPEQLQANGQLDGRCDGWALGVVAYEALTGWPPFSGSSIADLIVAISTRRADPPSSLRSELPRALDAWFDRALAKDASERFETPKEMAAAFRAALRGSGPRRSNAIRVGALVGSLALAGVAIVGVRWLAEPSVVEAPAASTPAAPAALAAPQPADAVPTAPATSAPATTDEPSAARSATLPSTPRRPAPRATPAATAQAPPTAAPTVAAPAPPTSEPLPPKVMDKSENQ